MRCADCNAEITLGSVDRIGFRDTCDACDADLHTCHNCRHHDPAAYNECHEPNAERVSQRDRANRCDWFEPGDQSGGEGPRARDAAKTDLEALFKK